MEQKTIYISGKIGPQGITPETRARFTRVAEWLLTQGHSVMNPTAEHWQAWLNQKLAMRASYDKRHGITPYARILALDIDRLKEADVILLLQGWQDSPGSVAEKAFAEATGKEVWHEEDFDIVTYPKHWMRHMENSVNESLTNNTQDNG